MKTQHTPGKWEVKNLTDVFTEKEAVNSEGIKADMYDGWQIADCSGGLTHVKRELKRLSLKEVEANARLTAAAPDLLEALLMWQKCINEKCLIKANEGEKDFLIKTTRVTLEAIKRAT